MKFDLTDEIRNQIFFSMEDQGNSYFFDSENLKTVLVSEVDNIDDRYYRIPQWGSVNGFKLMERFVLLLRNPLARESLRAVLFSGRGVFRNFKKVLKEYPEVERLWYTFKEREMNQLLLNWYNVLCESWGLEKLGVEPEENTDLVHDDFVFREENSDSDSENLFMSADSVVREIETLYHGEPGIILGELWQNQRYSFEECDEFTLVAETVEGEYAGCITASLNSEMCSHTVLISMLFVIPRYRGLGVGRELLTQCLNKLREKGICYVIVANIIIPTPVANMFLSCGFTQLGTGFVMKI